MDNQRQIELKEKLENFGDPRLSSGWATGRPDYVHQLSLTEEDIPQLLSVTREWIECTDWPDDENDMSVYAPIHAWRSLGQLKAIEALPLLLEMNVYMAENDHDWHLSEFPDVFSLLGPSIIPQLAEFLTDHNQNEYARICCAHGLTRIAQQHSNTRLQVIEVITQQLCQDNPELDSFNGLLIGYLLDLRATESAEAIERTFAANCVDLFVCGDWHDVRMELGIEEIEPMTKRESQAKTSLLFDFEPQKPIKAMTSSHTKTNARKKRKAQRQNKKRSRR